MPRNGVEQFGRVFRDAAGNAKFIGVGGGEDVARFGGLDIPRACFFAVVIVPRQKHFITDKESDGLIYCHQERANGGELKQARVASAQKRDDYSTGQKRKSDAYDLQHFYTSDAAFA
jgi:hypothetical protein